MVRKNVKSQGAISKLADLGVTLDQSSEWQKLAAMPEEKFETHLAGWREDVLDTAK